MILHKHRNKLTNFLDKFKDITNSPEIFLEPQLDKVDKAKEIVKELYDYTKQNEAQLVRAIPNVLYVDDMDEEQIWQQLELQNEDYLTTSLNETSKLLAPSDEKFQLLYRVAGDETIDEEESEIEENDDQDNDSKNESELDDLDSMSDGAEESNDDEKNNKIISQKATIKSGKRSIVDDEFFKLDEMRQFLDQEDRKEFQQNNEKTDSINSEDDVDYFADDMSDESDDDNMRDLKYSDFFNEENNTKETRKSIGNLKSALKSNIEDLEGEDSDISEFDAMAEEEEDLEDVEDEKAKGRVRFNLSNNEAISDSGDDIEHEENATENDPENKSSFEQRQERLRRQIDDFEEQALAEKSWQLKGEVHSAVRPQNSLLEEILNFETTTRPAPVITEETTLQLEDIIKQRVKDKAWNDVERKYKPIHTPQEFRKKLIMDQEKSKESLAQIYEKDYLKEVNKLTPNESVDDKKEPEAHKEIRKTMKSLFDKLDALSNFFYTPRPAMPEMRVITNTPAIEIEEVAPIAMSSAQLLAPEEIKRRPKGDVIATSERSKFDKNRERRKKKLKQKQINLETERRDKDKQLLGIKTGQKQQQKDLMRKLEKNRNVKKMEKQPSTMAVKTSKDFFKHLQDQAVTGKTNKKDKGKRPISTEKSKSAKKFKL